MEAPAMSDSSQNDPRRFWQEQSLGTFAMTEAQILSKARRLQFDARAEVIGVSVASVGVALFLFIGSLFEVFRRNGGTFNLWSLGWLICTALLVLFFALVAHAFYRFLWPQSFNADIDGLESLHFCRQELQRRQFFSRVLWRRSVPVFCVGVAMIVLAALRSVIAGILGGVSITLVVAVGYWLRQRDAARIEFQLIELNLLGSSSDGGEKGNAEPRPPRRAIGTPIVILIWVLLLVVAVVIYSLLQPYLR
jgi:hypothetical protein